MKYFYIILFFLLANCNLNELIEIHGISNLKLKLNNIKLNVSNENDIIKLIGPPIIKDAFDKSLWSYFEIRKKNTYLGKKKLILNDVVVLKFNNQGILIDFKTYDINSLNQITFNTETTKGLSKEDSTLKNVLTSTRKRMEMLNNKN